MLPGVDRRHDRPVMVGYLYADCDQVDTVVLRHLRRIAECQLCSVMAGSRFGRFLSGGADRDDLELR